MKKTATSKATMIAVLLSASILSTVQVCVAQRGQLLLALSKGDHTMAVVDPSSLKVLGKVLIGEDPHEVTASTDGKTAYVSIYGGGKFHVINVIDLASRKRLDDIDTSQLFGPHGLTFVRDRLWFSAEGSKAAGRFNPSTEALEWAMGTGQDGTHMIAVTVDGSKAYTTNMASGTLSILENRGQLSNGDEGEDWRQHLLDVWKGCEGFDISPDSSELWTASAANGKIYVVDLKSEKVSTTIDAKVTGANRLKFTLDGKLVFVSSLNSGNLTILDSKTHKQVKQIKIGTGAAGMQMDPAGTRAFVSCTSDDYIVIIDLKTLTVTGKLDVGKNPDGLAWVTQ